MNITKMKKVLVGTTLAGVMTAAASYGTYSWFTSTVTATGDVTNAVLQLNNGEENLGEVLSAKKFAPSQLVWGNWLTIDNTGNVDALLEATLQQTINKDASLDAYKVGYVALKYTVKPTEEVLKASQYKLQQLFKGTTNEVTRTLAAGDSINLGDGVELVSGFVEPSAVQARAMNEKIDLLGDGAEAGKTNKFWKLNPNQYIDIQFAFKLDEHAGNEYQGAKYKMNFTVTAKQADEGAKSK
ncbi:hypothetical protein [Bacillus sp. 165]|uniref:hypothetical protein n=1 Tax=Bacillus sp. 165 TaxID=1529117 RepID=UPI001AD991E5|nr:hypothetical protein [Bacillus sp. 165]MBO9128801.1 hypothetical protein [Bacillus sp. 165]